MLRVRLSQRARDDFDEIISYLHDAAGRRIAQRYGQHIRASINRLEELPHIGPPRPELGESMRAVIVAPYVIFYDPDSFEGVVHVFRILHAHATSRKALCAVATSEACALFRAASVPRLR